jgi:hypothetical protein
MWLIGLLNPVAAFIKACKAIYDIVKFFMERAEQVGELVNAILDSVGAIAGGALGEAAGKVENALAKAIPVAIGFLASLLGLGGISEKIKSVIHAIQEPIHNIISKVLGVVLKPFKWIGNKIKQGAAWAKKKLQQGVTYVKEKAKAGVAYVKGKAGALFGKKDSRTPEEKQQQLNLALADANALLRHGNMSIPLIKQRLPSIRAKYGLTNISLVTDTEAASTRTVHVHAEINPGGDSDKVQISKPGEDLSAEERGVVDKLDGGKEVLATYDTLDQQAKQGTISPDAEQRRKSLLSEMRVALDAINRGKPIIYVGREIPKTKGKGTLTEVDVETDTEFIEVKGADYTDAKKLQGGDELTQFTRLKDYNEKWRYNPDGTRMPPKQLVYHFTHPNPPGPKLVKWLQERNVEVRHRPL